jgi:hypothetical protein
MSTSATLPAARDALALSSLLLDRSDEIFEDSRKLTRVLCERGDNTFTSLADLKLAAADGTLGQSCLSLMRGVALQGAGKDAKIAQESIRELQMHREMVIESRKEALSERIKAMEQAKDSIAMELKEKMKTADSKLLDRLKAIVAGSGSGGNVVTSPSSS